MLCGHIGSVPTGVGFGLAGILRLFGLIMFLFFRYLGPNHWYKINQLLKNGLHKTDGDSLNLSPSILYLSYYCNHSPHMINDPMSKIYDYNIFGNSTTADYVMLGGVLIFVSSFFPGWCVGGNLPAINWLHFVWLPFTCFWPHSSSAGGSMGICQRPCWPKSHRALPLRSKSSTPCYGWPRPLLSVGCWRAKWLPFGKYSVANIVLISSLSSSGAS